MFVNDKMRKALNVVLDNKVVILFVILCVAATAASKTSLSFIATELFTRIGRNTFLVLSLIIPVLAGMGLNFGIVIGAMAAQIAVFCAVYFGFSGLTGFGICILIATPLAILFGFLVGKLFNSMKGSEMIAGMVLGYFADGLYQLLFLFIIGGIIPVNNPTLIIQGGIGVKNTIDLKDNLKYSIDNVPIVNIITAFSLIAIVFVIGNMLYKQSKGVEVNKKAAAAEIIIAACAFGVTRIPTVHELLSIDRLPFLTFAYIACLLAAVYSVIQIIKLKKAGRNYNKPVSLLIAVAAGCVLSFIPAIRNIFIYVKLPVLTYICIALLCMFNTLLMRTKLGQDMRTVGQNRVVANSAGINVDRTRIIAMILSTVFASWGQLILLQNLGTFSTYGAHTQVGQFAIAALLVGGASVHSATNKQAIIGIILFHTLFIVAPLAGKNLFGNAQIGEYFRVFVAYGVIAVSLAMHAWKTAIKPKLEGKGEEKAA